MMKKRKWLYRIGVLLFSIGLILANFYSDIPSPFPNLHKGIGMSVVIGWSALSDRIKFL